MVSIVIKGRVNRDGNLSGPVPNANLMSRNEWEFKIVSVTFSPSQTNLDTVLELGCSFSTSTTFNYTTKTNVDKYTPLTVKYFSVQAGSTKTYVFSDNVFPWIKMDQAADRLDISFLAPGTTMNNLPLDVDTVCHFIARRIK